MPFLRSVRGGWPRIIKRSGLFLLGLFLGFAAEYILSSAFLSRTNLASGAVRQEGYNYIHPLLLCGNDTGGRASELQSLHDRITSLLHSSRDSAILDASIYFRDLNAGTWTGINEEKLYHPASLLKVPVMIAYFSEAGSDPSILSKKILYTGPSDQLAEDGFLTLAPQKTYTVEELIEVMIRHSDNGALQLLVKDVNPSSLEKIFKDLNLPFPSNQDGSYEISAKDYSYFFRILYNATYLTKEYSGKALKLLSQTTFNDGLVAGVPSRTVVAHKFGEYREGGFVTHGELHDCGVVYHPSRPYLICVMTRGERIGPVKSLIKTISETVYQSANADYK